MGIESRHDPDGIMPVHEPSVCVICPHVAPGTKCPDCGRHREAKE